MYSKTSIARTPMACLSWLIQTCFVSLRSCSRKQILKEIILFHHESVCFMCSLELHKTGGDILKKIRFALSCELSVRQTMHMKIQAKFSRNKKKNISEHRLL